MELREFGPDDAASVEAYVAVDNAADATDSPEQFPRTPHRMAGWLRHGWDGEPPRPFLVEEGGRVVGRASLSLSERDNLDLAWLRVVVHPDHRRRGIGSAALAALHDECRRLGRPLVGIDGWDSEATTGFATRHGYRLGSRSAQRRQPLRDLGAAFLEAAYAEAAPAAGDYELLRFAGATPSELHEALVEVTGSINDAPLDDLVMEDEVFTAERIAAFETAQLASGNRLYRVVARHRASGALVGHTVVTVEEERPWLGAQEDTTVMAAHRGHRLGLLLKADLGRWLLEAEPELTTLETWNAVSNAHMIGVNERLGYRYVRAALEFQQRLPD